jgi:hypothetical protein
MTARYPGAWVVAYRSLAAILLVILLSASAQPAEPKSEVTPPRPAPPLFATVNYGIMASIPPGLTYCPLPSDWVGSDHGTGIYLTPPAGCHRYEGYPSSGRGETESVPTISLYYAYNAVDEIDLPSYFGPPRNESELMKLTCEDSQIAAPNGLTLLGKPAVGCRYDHGDQVRVTMAQLYSLETSKLHEAPDCELVMTLTTTRPRLAKDLRIFGAITKSISVCTPKGYKPFVGRTPCPQSFF